MRTFADLNALRQAAEKDPTLAFRVKRSEAWDHGWGTNVPLLAAACAISEGPVLEIGGGNFSTPVLAAICKAQRREFVTLDNDKTWIKSYSDVQIRAAHVPDWETWCDKVKEEIKAKVSHWGLIFVDHRPDNMRLPVLQAIRGWSDYIVVHDTCNPYFKGVDEFLSKFAWRYDWGFMASTTTVVSDTHSFDTIAECV